MVSLAVADGAAAEAATVVAVAAHAADVAVASPDAGMDLASAEDSSRKELYHLAAGQIELECTCD